MKKWIQGTVVCLLLSTLMAACSSGTKSTGSETAAPAETTTATTASSPAADGADKAHADKLSLYWFVDAAPTSNLPDADKDFVKKTIEQKFNVDLKLEYLPIGTDYNTKINLLMATGSGPDMWRDNNGDGGTKYSLDGVLADMTPYVSPATMPNYFKYWTTEDEVKNYRIQNQFVRFPVPYEKISYRSYYIRKDWLDNLGLKIPTNYDEYYKVLQAFTNNDPDQNGKKDTYGFSTSGNGTSISLEWPEFIKEGLTFPSFLENNKFIDMQTDPRIEQVIDDIVKLNKEGLVDPDWFLNKGTANIDKAVQGKVGVVMGTTRNFAFDSDPQSIQFLSKQINPKANWVAFTPFPDVPLRTAPVPGFPILFSKTVADKNPEKITRSIEILDWLAGEEGYLLTHYGEEGKDYTREGSTIKLNLEAFDADVVKQGNFLDIWSFFSRVVPKSLGLTIINPKESDQDRATEAFVTSIPVRANIGRSVVPPDGVDLGAFRARMSELQIKAIFDDKSGKNWPAYRDELLTKYNGQKIFDTYEEQLRSVGVIK